MWRLVVAVAVAEVATTVQGGSSRALLFGGDNGGGGTDMPPERVAGLVADFAARGAREACYAEAALGMQR
jgi:hypothetical protein